ncbi:hypothetical protein [Nostoc punctiforme]
MVKWTGVYKERLHSQSGERLLAQEESDVSAVVADAFEQDGI